MTTWLWDEHTIHVIKLFYPTVPYFTCASKDEAGVEAGFETVWIRRKNKGWCFAARRMGLGMHLPVTSGLRQEVQLLLLCPNTYVVSSSPFSLQSARLSWSNSR